MNLRELAAQHNLALDLLREVVGEDLGIKLPKGVDTPLKEAEIARILASDGLETADGHEFKPIIAKAFEEKHKRKAASKKGAETRLEARKRKLAEEEEKKRLDDEARMAEERKKHEAELARRRVEDEARQAAEAEAARLREAEEAKSLLAASRLAAEEELKRREQEARRMAAEFAAIRAQGGAEAPAESAPEAAPIPAPAPAQEPTPSGIAVPPPQAVPAPAPVASTPPAAQVAAAPPGKQVDRQHLPPAPAPVVKAVAGLGSRLKEIARATHEKADHSIKGAAKVEAGPAPSEALSAEERRRLILGNIQKNLEMQKRVAVAKAAAKRNQGFRAIDRTKGPAGPAGRGPAGRGPAGRGPGGPGGAKGGPRGHGRGKDARTVEEAAEEEGKAGRRYRSTLEEDISGVTEFTITVPCTVREFSEASGVKVPVIMAKLLVAGMMATINSVLEKDAVELLAQEFKKTVTVKEASDQAEEAVAEAETFDDKPEDLAPRPPVVTIMGHVDHGKTSLLDAIRKTNVAEGEAGGITQHIGAYTVSTASGNEVTFIDTPGHQAFTAMRARGAQITDVVVIVVAADDGVMPQTVEAINHAKAAGVPVVVAMNKCDKPEATKQNQETIIRQLAENGLQAEEWGGEIAVVRTSATTGAGIDELLERLALEAEMLELRSNHFAKASGTVIEAHRHEGQGVTATFLVQRGSLAIGDVVLAGVGYGKVRSMTNWKGERVELAGPSHAVEVTGLDEMPRAGDRLTVMDDLQAAAAAAESRRQAQREKDLAAKQKTTTANTLFADLAQARKKEVRVVVKADASGSVEVLNKTIADLANDEVRVTVIHSGVGGITASDVTLAEASKAMIIGFNVIADGKAREVADQAGLDIRTFTIIYELLDELRAVVTGQLEPQFKEVILGHAEVRKTFVITKVGVVAGLFITDGLARRDAFMRITRDQKILHTGKVGSLRRFKEDVKEVAKDYECGLTVEGFQDIQPGDIFEFFAKEKAERRVSR